MELELTWEIRRLGGWEVVCYDTVPCCVEG